MTTHRAALATGAHSLRIAGLRKLYAGIPAVDDVTITVPRGEFLTLLGPSGSGKTTLLMMIAGFVAPNDGSIHVDDRDITGLAPERRNFGMVFQGYALFPHMTVAENVAYPLRVRRVARAEMAERVRAALAMVRLDTLADRQPRQLSGGQQQRVAIARALVYQPDILLLDEPLGALDRQLRAEVQIELKALHARLGTTFVYVTHDQEEAMSMSDRVAILRGGRLIQLDTPAALYERPRNAFVAGFLGTSNVIEARYEGGLLLAGGMELTHAGPGTPQPGPCRLSLRPEQVKLSASEPFDLVNRSRCRIVTMSYLGAIQTIILDSECFGRLTASAFARGLDTLAPGQTLWAGWTADATCLLEADDIPVPSIGEITT